MILEEEIIKASKNLHNEDENFYSNMMENDLRARDIRDLVEETFINAVKWSLKEIEKRNCGNCKSFENTTDEKYDGFCTLYYHGIYRNNFKCNEWEKRI